MHRKENRVMIFVGGYCLEFGYKKKRQVRNVEWVAICNAGENEKYLRRRFSSTNIGYGCSFLYTHSRVCWVV